MVVGKKTKKSNSGLDELSGYKVLPVQIAGGTGTHYLYFKQHTSKREDPLLPSSRTIYISNVPADATERDLRRLFQGVARVARVVFHSAVGQDAVKVAAAAAQATSEISSNTKVGKGKAKAAATTEVAKAQQVAPLLSSGGSAHVVLLEDVELGAVLGMKAGVREWAIDSSHGLARHVLDYGAARPAVDAVRADVDAFMARFEEAQYERERMLEQQQNVADADGFIPVVRRARGGKNTDGTASVTAMSTDEAREAGAARKEPTTYANLYRFQARERKRDQLVDLRRKFEEDKEKIARMRQARQFRPY
ncbi:hypothetical protein IW146_006962 [Coemansia sp. RSA 922]|nr:hypothetical protein GGI14_003645 [Coemansia sp. S680]KAJ2030084.1 hypothetical protein H4S03_007194 [Coemansia sp. S3946]KAJ2033475.1 hypothetical protein GGI08_009107 [Coemansia sp. S2]KAJ2046034.1 hypothetical protein H4S04_005278 [Coemansia sp. S16]KAJ2070303.1 hypothetical protein GGH13_004118 [Coemansia sp. S155-1]KAJ2083983.1 hypothetical protein GGI09_007311 [Coemansia sp. S100]KAJ2094568.1 hypothetical protein GGI16_005497 [Coemansia sp. S142-1]KAJ2108176.1 hypothetical protein I